MSSVKTPVRLQAALNGFRRLGEHPMLPLDPRELASDAAACVAAGADAVHVHPRDETGAATLAPQHVDAAVRAIRDATGLPVGVSTSQAIERDPARRAEQIGAWTEPDYASVNLSEDDAADVIRLLRDQDVGIEAGISEAREVDVLTSTGLGDAVARVLVEPVGDDPAAALAAAADIHEALDAAGITAPRLQHSDGPATWAVLDDALARGLATRVGLEDTLNLDGGLDANSNADLVTAAALRAGITTTR